MSVNGSGREAGCETAFIVHQPRKEGRIYVIIPRIL
jgi:hypothetical protein